MTLTTPRLRDPHRRRVLLATLVVGALTLTLSTACKQTGGADATKTPANQGLNAVDPSSSTADGTGDDNGGSNGSGSNSSPSATAKPSASKSPATTKGPTIKLFKVVAVTCGGVGQAVSYPSSISLQWVVTGATTVAISIDDANFPKNNNGAGTWRSDYAPTFTTLADDVSFACGGSKGNKTHTYTLSAVSDGVLVTKTVSATAYWEGADALPL